MDEEESEQPQRRRRSARIIALEERKEKEKAAARKNNINSLNKGKGKAIMQEEYDYDFKDDDNNEDDDDDDDDDEYDIDKDEHHAPSRKKGRKSKPLNQLMISSIQAMEGGQNTEHKSASRRTGLPKIPDKQLLECVLDALQRKDPDELFAEPVNGDEGYYKIVKKPMDFATMRAKLHENMYTDIEQFKRDVYLICSNAMNVNPADTAYHKVAEAINELASKIFHAITVDPANFGIQFLNNKRKGRKPGRPRNSGRIRHFAPKPGGRSCGNSREAELDRRSFYRPPRDNSLSHEIMYGPRQSPQLNMSASNYEESLCRFVQDLGPVAKSIAANKIKSLHCSQFVIDQTPTPNLHSQHHYSYDADYYPILSNRPLTIPGNNSYAPHQHTRNLTTNFDKGKQVCEHQSWDKGTRSYADAFNFNADDRMLMLGAPTAHNFMGATSSTAAREVRRSAPGLGLGLRLGPELGRGRSQVWPSCVIPGSQPKPKPMSELERQLNDLSRLAQPLDLPGPSQPMTDYNLTRQSLNLLSQMKPAPDEPLTNYDFSAQSLLSPQNHASDPFRVNLSLQSLISQFKCQEPVGHSNNFLGPSFCQTFMPQSKPMVSSNFFELFVKPTDPMTGCNLPWHQPFMSQPKPAEVEPMTGFNIPVQEQPLLSQLMFGELPINDQYNNNLSETLPKPLELMNDYNQSFLAQMKLSEPMSTGYNNFSGPDFQSMFGSTNSNNPISFPDDHHVDLYPPPPPIEGFSDDFPMQLEPEPSPLSPLGLFPEQETTRLPSAAAAALEKPMGQPDVENQQPADDRHPNLSLGL